jgi:hypothetical protein
MIVEIKTKQGKILLESNLNAQGIENSYKKGIKKLGIDDFLKETECLGFYHEGSKYPFPFQLAKTLKEKGIIEEDCVIGDDEEAWNLSLLEWFDYQCRMEYYLNIAKHGNSNLKWSFIKADSVLDLSSY